MHCHSAESKKRFYLTHYCLGHYHFSLSLSIPTLASSSNMTDLINRLTALSPQIEQLMEIGGAAGLSLGVLHPVYQANFGWERCSKFSGPDRQTRRSFPLVRCRQPLLPYILVDEKRITWDKLVKDVLTEYEPEDYVLRDYTTIADLFCQRTGWLGAIVCISGLITIFEYQAKNSFYHFEANSPTPTSLRVTSLTS